MARREVRLNSGAARFFGIESGSDAADFQRLGSIVADRREEAVPIGAWIVELLNREPDPILGVLVSDDGHQFIYAAHGNLLKLFQLARADSAAPKPTSEQDLNLKHRFRNAVNAIQMNAELIAMLADRSDATDIKRAADRVLDECRRALAAD